jgi:hypothetical protein
MKKRFMVVINRATPENERSITDLFSNKGLGWWHWLKNIWLISDPNGTLSATAVRDSISQILPATHSLVIEIDNNGVDTWAARGTNAEQMFSWLHKNWTKSS